MHTLPRQLYYSRLWQRMLALALERIDGLLNTSLQTYCMALLPNLSLAHLAGFGLNCQHKDESAACLLPYWNFHQGCGCSEKQHKNRALNSVITRPAGIRQSWNCILGLHKAHLCLQPAEKILSQFSIMIITLPIKKRTTASSNEIVSSSCFNQLIVLSFRIIS